MTESHFHCIRYNEYKFAGNSGRKHNLKQSCRIKMPKQVQLLVLVDSNEVIYCVAPKIGSEYLVPSSALREILRVRPTFV